METIISYFDAMPSAHRSILLFGGLAFFMVLETLFPYFSFRYKRVKHTGLNIFFTLTTALINLSLAFLLFRVSDWSVANSFGLFHWLDFTPLAMATLGLVLMDGLGAWLPHFLEHKIPFLWKWHIVHHSDKQVDATTANRHHPGESVIRFSFTLMAVFLLGAPMWMIIFYQSCSVVFSQFSHSNLVFNKKLDRLLSYIIVTPRMHRVHHHYRLPYTDSNYGNIFSIYDRLAGSFAELDNHKLVFGVDTHFSKPEADNLGTLLKIPFLPYRKPEAHEPLEGPDLNQEEKKVS